MASRLDENWKKPLKGEKNKNGQKKNRRSTMLEDWEELTLSIKTTENTQKILNNARKNGNTYGSRDAV